jgi:pimeloyl-ACP methyl ester carboxylesterase
VPLWQVSMQQATEGVPPANLRAAKAQELAALDAIRNGSNHASGMIWYRSSMDVDPVVDIKRVKSPILILQGASDVQVLPTDLPRLTAAAKSANRDVTWHVFPSDNHLFMSVTPGEPLNPNAALNQYLTVPAWIDQNVLQTMIAWLDARSAKT